MAMVGEVRVVPSGKVYRQIFDAEVQLVRSLGETRARAAQHGTSLDSGKLPLIRDMDTHTAGLLSDRQRLWVDSMPYNYLTENPVSYREIMTSTLKKTQENETVIAAREVRGLLDVIVPEKDSGVLQRIAANRHERHDIEVSTLQKALAQISKEMESLVLETGRTLQQKNSASDNKMERLFWQIENSSNNATFTMKALTEIWDEVAEETLCRRQWIKDTERTLLELEEKRANHIAEVLKKYTSILKNICYFMPSDVYRFIHKEAMMINQAILANHRAIAKLFVNLMEADLKREGAQRLRWQDLVNECKFHQKESMIQEFREFANREMIQIHNCVNKKLDLMMTKHRALNKERLHLLTSVSDFLPPTCTKTQVSEWHKSLVAINKQSDTLNVQFIDGLRRLQKKVSQKCMEEAQTCKEQLVSMKICGKEEAEKILANELYPLIEQFQIQFEKEQEPLGEALGNLEKQTDFQCNELFRFTEGAVLLWDVLEIGLSEQENALEKKLNNSRQKYAGETQMKEANLDMILDRLRQESSPEQLRSTMAKALLSLEDIKAGYKKSHRDQVVILDSYPAMVLTEVTSYSLAVSNYFKVKEVYGQVDKRVKETTSPVNIFSQEGMSLLGEVTSESPKQVSSNKMVQGELSHEAKQLDGTGVTMPNTSEDKEQLSQEIQLGGINVTVIETPEKEGLEDCVVQIVPEVTENCSPEDRQQPDSTNAAMSESNPEQPLQASETNDAVLVHIEELSQEDVGPADQELEVFTTSSGNTYTILPSDQKYIFGRQSEFKEAFMTEAVIEEKNPLNLDLIAISEDLFPELKKMIRLGFFEHLEQWFDKTISNSHSVVVAKKEELKSELELRYHLHEPRSKRIEMDVHHVRAAELLLHSERVDRHCSGVTKALTQLKNECASLIERMKKETCSFRNKICAMESTFLNANKSDKLVALSSSLSSVLDSHVNGVQTSMRNYRQHVEEMLGVLCDTNSDFIKSFQIFSEGGNFSPVEVETLRVTLHKASATIASFEGSILVDLEWLESLCLEQATEIVKKFEDKFFTLTADLIFLENIQRLLTNLQVKIKALVVNSNLQTQQINSYLEQLHQKIDACAYPNMDKEAITAEELHIFVKSVMDGVAKRSIFLSCLLEPSPVLSEPPLQGSIAAAAAATRLETPLQQEGKVTFETPDTLLNPSRIGKLALDDAAVIVIKNIMKTQQIIGDAQHDQGDSDPVSRQNPPIVPRPPAQPASGMPSKRIASSTDGENIIIKSSSACIRKLIKPSRFDKKYQVFGEKREESDNFKGTLTSILWESNDTLLYLAEEFYNKKKERRSTGRPDLLHENFEECADMLILKHEAYEKQAHDYHNSCLQEFREQLETFEKLLSQVPPLVIESHRQQHLEYLHSATAQIRQSFIKDLHNWDHTKEKIKSVLRPNLGHPDSSQAMDDLCQQEEKRQREEVEGIDLNTEHLRRCVSKCTTDFITSLASLAETLLLELDEALNVDEVLSAKTEFPKEKLSTLIRRKQASLFLENTEYQPLIKRGSRVWPGIRHVKASHTKLEDTTGCPETASVTTAKTTLSHISTVEARDAAYSKFLQDTEVELDKIYEESRQQHFGAQRWKDWWTQSVQKIKRLYS
ncbi:coiled-coil domain-containing protein 180 isoform X3 [Ascaphus truei]